MMSAGLGTLSRAFVGNIADEPAMSFDSQQTPTPNIKLDDFDVVKELGRGAFGKVTLVRHKESQTLFAMKQMDKAKFKAQKMTNRALSEQFILKTTRHRFIVALHYAFQGPTMWALIMDYCPHGDLMDALVRQGDPGLKPKDVARVCGEVILAVGHLHSVNVIYRDLKPDNVVLDAS